MPLVPWVRPNRFPKAIQDWYRDAHQQARIRDVRPARGAGASSIKRAVGLRSQSLPQPRRWEFGYLHQSQTFLHIREKQMQRRACGKQHASKDRNRYGKERKCTFQRMPSRYGILTIKFTGICRARNPNKPYVTAKPSPHPKAP
jgi:hypothetical protein